jgi:DNA-directed RNA polymerase subunit RPC12/RpoP
MAGTTGEDEAAATVPMIGTDECTAAVPMARRRRWDLESEPPAEVRAAARRAGRLQFRRYCVACGRSTEGAGTEDGQARCPVCGGTMLVEPVAE